MKKVLLSILLMLLPILASADPVEVDGIWYNLITKAQAAEVTKSHSGNEYSGDVIIPDEFIYDGVEYSVTMITNSTFSFCSGLNSVTIGNNVTSIGQHAFYKCSGLTSVTIGNSVESIGEGAFYSCRALKSVHISNIKAWCGIMFDDYDSNPLYYAKHLFVNGEEIKDLVIPNSVESIGGNAFYSCSGLTSVTIPSSVTSIGNSAFSHCSGLTYVIIGNNVTSIGQHAFSYCSGLTSVTIGNNVESIRRYAFYWCSGLTSVSIPNSVTSIYDYAFSNCTSLTSVNLGSGMKYIYEESFAKCEELTDVYCMVEKVIEEWGGDGLYTNPNAFMDSYPQAITLHVPAASIEAYHSTEPWSLFKTIVALGDDDNPEIKKCATPEINYANGKLDFSCETEDVQFVSEVIVGDAKKYYDASVTLSQTYKVTVYATKAGYENSDVTTREIVITGNGKAVVVGDVNNDGKVNVADHVKLSDIIMNK